MRISSLLLVLLVGTASFLSTTLTQAVAINLRTHDKSSSSLGVLSSTDQVHASTIVKTDNNSTTTSPPTKKDLITDAHDKAKDLINEYHELPEWARYTMASAGLVLGLVLGLFGYQFIRTTIFVVCGFVCAALMYGLLETSLASNQYNRAAIIYASSAAVGLVAALIFLYYTKIAFVFIGASLGIMLAVVLDPIALRFIWPAEPVINLYLWMAVFGIVTGSLVLCLEKPIFVISTAVVGSFIFILSIAAFAGGLEVLSTYKVGEPVPDQAWYFFGGFIACVLVAMSVQFCYTATSESDDAHKDYKELK